MMSPIRALKRLRAIANDSITMEEARFSKRYFTRNRKMSFADALCFMLDMRKTTIQTRLNLYFKTKGCGAMSQQAFSKLRSHFDHSPFEKMVRALVEEEYSEPHPALHRLGYHLFAIDGSWLQLPQRPEVYEFFGSRDNSGYPCAGASILFDVLSGWVLNPVIARGPMNERAEAERHICFLLHELPQLASRSLILLDRGYPSLALLKKLDGAGVKYLMRCSPSFLCEVNTAAMGDTAIFIKKGKLHARVYKFLLPSGETEILLTNLRDVSQDDLAELYGMRWGIETAFHRLKRELCVEKFSGLTPNTLFQDFWASMVLMNTVAVFERAATDSLKKRQWGKNLKHVYKIRCSDLIVTLRDEFIFAVLHPDATFTSAEIDRIVPTLARAVSAIRSGRSFPRPFKHSRAANQHLKSHL